MTSQTDSVDALILCGGQSSRLFPFNKVLSDLTGSGRTLLQQAADRISRPVKVSPRIAGPKNVYVLSIRDFVPDIRRQLRLPLSHCFADPVRRGTWPAILWAMAQLRARQASSVLAVITADHLIPDVVAFRRSVSEAIALARKRPAMVMVGVSPSKRSEDWLGYGAFRTGSAGEVLGFEEKPSAAHARRMIAQRRWFWNAGMFFFRIETAEAALRTYQPSQWTLYRRITAAAAAGRMAEAARLYEKFPGKIPHPLDRTRLVDNTIDYAVMTPLVHRPQNGLSAWASAHPLKQWMDVGEWTALRRVVKPDVRGNYRVGRAAAARDVRGCILAADLGCRLIVSGVRSRIIAFSQGKALVIPIERVAEVKSLVAAARGRLVAVDAGDLRVQLSRRKLIVGTKA